MILQLQMMRKAMYKGYYMSISFVIDTYHHHHQGVAENLQQLHRMLLRIQAVVEEADSRRITNQAMLLQLRMMRDVMFRGYYFVDNFRYRIVQAQAKDEVGDHSLDLPPFSPLEQFCISTRARKIASEILEKKELQKMLGRLETIVSDMQEFVVLVSSYPRITRQPYCSYLLLENCMFGRQAEQERVIKFLLEQHPLGGAKGIDVLPIIGPGRIGKSTLVEHVCRDERVRKFFSKIVFYGPDSIENGDTVFLPDNNAIKYQNPASDEQSLAIIELVDEIGDETWRRILHSLRGDHITPVSKIIITSRSRKIETFGTTKALQLDFLPKEAFWYLFKTIAFGSTNPEEEPKLTSICMEIAAVVNGSFMGANITGGILRSNLSAQFWYNFLLRLKYFADRHFRLLGEHPRDSYNSNCGRTYIWMHKNYYGSSDAATYNFYEANSARLNNQPMVLLSDILIGNVKPQAKYEVLEWQSSIPPYYSYVVQYEILAQQPLMVPKRKRSRALFEELSRNLTMDTFFSAVLGDLLSRSISFVIDRYNQQQQSVEEDNLQQLHRVLLRIEAIAEEADGRLITNRAMLQQLGMLREMMFRGYYFLDNFRYRIAQAHAQDEEFVVFVSGYPRMKRQPYCSYLLLENCMFGRQAEQERVINFLLAPHPPGDEKGIDVLPIIGPGRVGKSTLVEHVCRDERVRKYFSTTVFYGPDSIGDGDLASLTDTSEIKHQNPASSKQSLAIIELVDEMDDETWRRILQSLRRDHVAPVSKIIITSRSNKIATFGTTKALHLDFFPKETIAFGSTNPEEEPKLASICMEIAAVLNGSFMGLNIVASILNSNLSAQFWYSLLKRLKFFTYRHIHLLGEHPRDVYITNSGRTYIWIHEDYCGDSDAVAYNYYQVNSARLNDLPTVLRSRDILTGTVKPHQAKYYVLEWQSSIPPYYCYIVQYEIIAQPPLVVPKRKRSQVLTKELPPEKFDALERRSSTPPYYNYISHYEILARPPDMLPKRKQSRSVSFLIDRYHQQQQDVEENQHRLHRVLLRIEATVEEADQRCITNQAMLLQLRMLRDMMYRGYYFLDNFRYRNVQAKAQYEVGDHSLGLPHFCPLKRFCISTRTWRILSEVMEKKELQKMLDHLQSIVSDMQEFVVLMSSYPRMSRQPYCSYLLMENCMFGRQIEKETIINFLLEPHRPAGSKGIDVLPIIGPCRVGKTTLVEHVCHDEMVRKYFSKILLYGADSIEDGELVPLTEIGVIKHRNPVSTGQSLLIIELVNDMDDEAWTRILHRLRRDHLTPVSKIIITSRSNKIATFGTTEALQLDFLPEEEFWYFFKTMVFGSTNPEEEPELAAICMEIAALMNRSFMGTYIIGDILRSNLNPQFWYKFLECFKYYTDMHIRELGEHPSETYKRISGHTCVWTPENWCVAEATYALTYTLYQASSADLNDQPMVLASDVLVGNVQLQGKIDVLQWRSKIPPYYCYMAHFEKSTEPSINDPLYHAFHALHLDSGLPMQFSSNMTTLDSSLALVGMLLLSCLPDCFTFSRHKNYITMDAFFSAVLGDLLSRSISFMVDSYYQQNQGVEENLQQLQRLLLRIQAIVEEADSRHITNQAMLLQLGMLSNMMYRGYYFLDNFRCQIVQAHAQDEVGDRSLGLSSFNPLKQFCFSTATRKMVSEVLERKELHKMLGHLESIVSDMQEFVVFVNSYPRMSRQPYCSYLLLENCMFGRQAEHESVVNFLLAPHPPCGEKVIDVLPIIGPGRVGKSTLVEHVCQDERVRKFFSTIVFYGLGSIENNGDMAFLPDSGAIKYRNLVSGKQSLAIIELVDEMDDETWRKILHSLRGDHTCE
uniref:Disease resistance N-terminal domain-containing protein n=1 Tax=Oryza punctata TaxID=4537 RepID=A0A0E0JND8_ORYPU